MVLLGCGLALSFVTNVVLGFFLYKSKKSKVLSIEAKDLLATILDRGGAVVKIQVLDSAGLMYMLPRDI